MKLACFILSHEPPTSSLQKNKYEFGRVGSCDKTVVPRVPRATSAGPRHLVLRSHHFCGCSTFFNGNTFQADFEAKYLFVLGCTQKLQGMGSGEVVITKGARFCRVQGWKRSMYNDIFTLPQTLLTLLLGTSVHKLGQQ